MRVHERCITIRAAILTTKYSRPGFMDNVNAFPNVFCGELAVPRSAGSCYPVDFSCAAPPWCIPLSMFRWWYYHSVASR